MRTQRAQPTCAMHAEAELKPDAHERPQAKTLRHVGDIVTRHDISKPMVKHNTVFTLVHNMGKQHCATVRFSQYSYAHDIAVRSACRAGADTRHACGPCATSRATTSLNQLSNNTVFTSVLSPPATNMGTSSTV